MFQTFGRLFAPLLLLALLALPAQAGESVRRAPAPAWAAPLEIPQPNPARSRQIGNGLYDLVADHQVRVEPGGYDSYERFTYQVTDRSGLEDAASIDLDFDPSRETLVLHHARAMRSGAVVDLLPHARIEVLNRESELNDGILTGEKTAHIELADVRVGDVVDYAYSYVSRDPWGDGQVFASQELGWAVPAGVTRFRVLWPHGKAPTVGRFAGAAAPTATRAGGFDAYEWRVVDPDPLPEEKDVPDWAEPYPRVEVSSLGSWAEVADWTLKGYQGYGPPAAWKAEIAAIAAANPRPADRVTAAIRLVEDKLRYVSLSIGAGSYRPRSPDAVVASGYGDCKEKSLLLAVVLRALGVEADPALTDYDAGPGLPHEVPSLNAFDHVIVRIRLDGKTSWVDATASHTGGRFPDVAGLEYAWALPVVAGQSRLEAVPQPETPKVTEDVLERYELPAGDKKAMTLTVTTVYSGADADTMRAELADRSLAATEKKYLDFYADYYPGVRATAPIAIAEDRDANLLSVREAYEIPRPALSRGKLMTNFPIVAGTLQIYALPQASARRNPLWLRYPVHRRHRIELVTPGRKPPAPPVAGVEGDGFKLGMAVSRKGDTLTIDYELTGKTGELPADKVADHHDKVDALDDATYWEIDLTSRAGGTIGREYAWLGFLLFGGFLAVLVGGLIVAMRQGGRADEAYAAQARFYPVSTVKFVVMAVATAGLYGLFFLWKSWRWAYRHRGEELSAFWRTFFAALWLFPLFRRANTEAGERRLPAWLGAAAAMLYFAWGPACRLAERYGHLPQGLGLLAPLAFVFLLPTVDAVQRANADAQGCEALAANSRFTPLSWAAMAFGGIVWLAYLLAATV